MTALVVSCGLTPPVEAARLRGCCACEDAMLSRTAAATISGVSLFIVFVSCYWIEFNEGLFTKLRACSAPQIDKRHPGSNSKMAEKSVPIVESRDCASNPPLPQTPRGSLEAAKAKAVLRRTGLSAG